VDPAAPASSRLDGEAPPYGSRCRRQQNEAGRPGREICQRKPCRRLPRGCRTNIHRSGSGKGGSWVGEPLTAAQQTNRPRRPFQAPLVHIISPFGVNQQNPAPFLNYAVHISATCLI